jgi:hypothetical protein
LKDSKGTELDYGDVVVVERGPQAGTVGRIEGMPAWRRVSITPDLWAPLAALRTVWLKDVRKANDIERARWKRDAKAREKAATDAWLNRSPESDL